MIIVDNVSMHYHTRKGRRTVLDRLWGRHPETPDEAVPRIVEAFLREHPAIRDLA